MKIKPLIIPTVLFLFIAPTTISAKNWYVSPTGKDTGNGTVCYTFQTIQKAIENMSSGDTCVLRKGTSREEITANNRGITLCAWPGEYVVITGSDQVKAKYEKYTNPQNNESCTRIKFNKKVYRLFINGNRTNLARLPDKTGSILSMKDWDSFRVDAAGAVKTIILPEIPNKPGVYWKGV